ncbi:MAG: chloride channel protein [Halanaerobiaceae bacterium]
MRITINKIIRKLISQEKVKFSSVPGMVIIAVIIGAVGGIGAVLFHHLIHAIQVLFFGGGEDFLAAVRTLPWYYRLAAPALGGLIIGPFVTFVVQEAKGHGVPEVMESVALKAGRIRPLVAPLKALVSAVCIGSGGSAGREGPIVQIGAAFGSTVGQYLKLNPRKVETLLGAGAAAGIAGTFNAPLAGVIFALEVLLRDIELDSFSPIVVASVVGTATANIFFGPREAIFNIPEHTIVSFWEFIPYIGLGIVAAGVALLFSNSLYSLEHLFEKINFPAYLKPALGGLLLGTLAFRLPEIQATGYPVIEEALHGRLPVLTAFILMLAKILATDLTLGSGGSGGVFAPSLFIGSMMGAAYGGALQMFFPEFVAGASSYAIVGMGAMFAGATHAPLTAIIILFEMTRDPMIFLPLMFACIISTVITSHLQHKNIYTTKLLNRGVDIDSVRESSVLRNIQVGEIMNREYFAVSDRYSIAQVREMFRDTLYSHLPVISEKTGGFIGMLSYQQVLSYLEEESGDSPIGEFIFPSPLALKEQDDLLTALKLCNKIDMEVLPVISDYGFRELLGLVGRKDIIKAYHRELTSASDFEISLASYQEVEVHDLVDFALKPLKQLVEEKDINIVRKIPGNLPPVSANSTKISWVLTNLLGNAIRYSKKGDKVVISASNKKSMVYISVTDNGPGIPEKYRQEIFKKYVQLDKDINEGKGIGLSISREIIEDHGGDIWVESKEGEGSTFTFTLETLPAEETITPTE